MESFLDRIRKIVDNEGVTIGFLEKKIGASKGVLSRAMQNKTDIQTKWIVSIVENYPKYSPEWLLTGEGSMLRSELPLATPSANPNEGIPLVPIEVVAGFNGIDEQRALLADCQRYLIPDFAAAGAEYLIRVSGSSMYPKYSNGDILACRKVKEVTFFQWGKIYVIDSQQGAIIKRVFQSENKNNIICQSENEKYPPFELPISEIRSLSIVVGAIKLE